MLKLGTVGAVLGLGLACVGQVSPKPSPEPTGPASDPPPSTRPADPPAASPFSCVPGAIDPGPSALQRLTREQYLNTVRDLFGDVPALKTTFAGGGDPAGTLGLVQGDVSQVELEALQSAADSVARAVVGNPTRLAAIAPCPAGADQRGCARDFLQRFGTRIYRAPIDPADVDRHLGLYDIGAQGPGGHAHGIEVLLGAMLQSPRFLYRVELGTGELVNPGAVKLSGFEMAARLSYAFWRTTPDPALLEAAARGELSTRAGVQAQLRRVLEDPRGARVMQLFLESWAELAAIDAAVKDSKAFPAWTGPVRNAMKTQARSFFDHVMSKEGGRLSALYGSPTVFVTPELAPWYGTDGVVGVRASERTDGSASGLLTLAAWLSIQAKPDQSSPIYRGKFVREQLLCQILPPPPPDAVIKPPEVKPGQSARERFRQHSEDPSCASCHQLMDPIGLLFENYDGIGRYRTEEGGQPIDIRGNIVGTSDLDGPVATVAELGRKLAASTQGQACVTQQWFRYVLARFEQPLDGCSLDSIFQAFRAGGQNLGQLPAAIAGTDAFLHRRPISPEVSP